MSTTTALQDAVAALTRLGCKPAKSGNGYKALCPVHEADGGSHTPSLTVAAGDTQPIVVCCQAGCDGRQILKVLGINGTAHKSATIAATYRYQTAEGIDVREKLRYEPKDFRIRHKDAAGNWIYKAGDGPAVLYRLPELRAAIAEGRTVFMVEGEKDADRLARLGLVATTNIEGAAKPEQRAKWRSEYTEQLSGAARVILLPDNDEPGRAHMRHIAKQLQGKVDEVRWLELSGLPEKGDVSDWLDAGHAIEELKVLVGEAPALPPEAPEETESAAGKPETAKAETTAPDENLFSDYGNIVKLIERLRDRIAYTPGLDWLLYNPATGIWEPEPGSERVKRLVMESLRESWDTVFYAAQQDADDLKKQLKEMDADDPRAAMIGKRVKLAIAHRDKVFAWMRQCETAYRIRSTLELAEGYFWTAASEWDANPHILICANGVLDLKSGSLLPHSPNYRATRTTGTEYRPNATHPAWNAVIGLLKSEGDRYAFVQQFCGSGLHGENPNERVVIFQGDGGTGKGTLLTAIHNALGDYVATVEVGSLLATDWRKQNKSAPREDLLKLRGARFVYPSIEPPKDSKLDDGSIKALTGNDAITARYPHGKNSITFLPMFKLAIQTNFPLQTEFDDPGMKRRVIVVPFNQKPKAPDPTVKNSLMHDPDARAAVLAWLYEGYRAWLQNDFALPESTLATEATAGYWADMNPYEQFARDVGLKFGKGLKCLKPRVTGAFKAWREENGRRDAAPKGFPKWLADMGCQEGWEGKDRVWFGVDFLYLPPSPPSPPSYSVNNDVELQYSKPTVQFHETGGGNGGDRGEPSKPAESPPDEPLAFELAKAASLDIGYMLSGRLTEDDWPKLTHGVVKLSETLDEAGKTALSALVSRIDTAFNSPPAEVRS